ncbi:MAG: hypothetical protein ACRDRL_29655 [Sciscionella sp.]
MNSKARWRRAIVGGLAIACVLLVTGLLAMVVAGSEWTYVEATLEGQTATSHIQLWYRDGSEAIEVESAGPNAVDIRCRDGVLTTSATDAKSIVVHGDLTRQQCFEGASARLLGFEAVIKHGDASLITQHEETNGRRTSSYAALAGPYTVFVLDDQTHLPATATLRGGGVLRFSYADHPAPPPIPPAPSGTGWSRETYSAVSRADLARLIDASEIPQFVGALSLRTTFTYQASTGDGPAYYAVWSSDDTDLQAQVVVSVGVPPISPGYEDAGSYVQFAANESHRSITVTASTNGLLRAVIQAVRPAYLPELDRSMPRS